MSPVVLHGPTGIGKSLMLSALAQRLRSGQRMRRVLYMTSEQFTNDFTEALRSGGLPLFRRKYRDVEALMLDDLQFLVGKRSTMAEVRHTIDNLLRAGRQIVVSVDRPLSELSGLGEELLGRLRGGLVAPVSPLDVHIRAKLLQQLSQEAGISIDPPCWLVWRNAWRRWPFDLRGHSPLDRGGPGASRQVADCVGQLSTIWFRRQRSCAYRY